MDRKAPHNVAFDAENRGVSVVLCQVLCLYAFVVGDTPLIDTLRPSMLLDQLEDWQEVLDLAIKAGNTEIQEKVEKQIRKINEKLKF